MKKSELIIALAESLAKRGDEVVSVNVGDQVVADITGLDNTADLCTEDRLVFAVDAEEKEKELTGRFNELFSQIEALEEENKELKERVKELEALKEEE